MALFSSVLTLRSKNKHHSEIKALEITNTSGLAGFYVFWGGPNGRSRLVCSWWAVSFTALKGSKVRWAQRGKQQHGFQANSCYSADAWLPEDTYSPIFSKLHKQWFHHMGGKKTGSSYVWHPVNQNLAALQLLMLQKRVNKIDWFITRRGLRLELCQRVSSTSHLFSTRPFTCRVSSCKKIEAKSCARIMPMERGRRVWSWAKALACTPSEARLRV